MRNWTYIAAGVLATLVACGGDEQAQENVVPVVTRDAQLLYTLSVGTEWIGAVGRDAQARASSDAARAFGATLAADHQGLHAAFASPRSDDLRPAESAAGQELMTNAQTTRVGMQSLDGAAFDLAFVESAIRLQQLLLTAIERDMTALQDSTLRRLAEQSRPTLQAHIQRGRQLLPELRAAETAGGLQTAAAATPATRPAATGGSGQTEGQQRPAPTPQPQAPTPEPPAAPPAVTDTPSVSRDTTSILQPVR